MKKINCGGVCGEAYAKEDVKKRYICEHCERRQFSKLMFAEDLIRNLNTDIPEKIDILLEKFLLLEKEVILVKDYVLNKKQRATEKSRGRLNKKDREFFWNNNKTICVNCKYKGERKDFHIDHIIPLSKGGTNDYGNLQALCARCNMNKSNFHE